MSAEYEHFHTLPLLIDSHLFRFSVLFFGKDGSVHSSGLMCGFRRFASSKNVFGSVPMCMSPVVFFWMHIDISCAITSVKSALVWIFVYAVGNPPQSDGRKLVRIMQ